MKNLLLVLAATACLIATPSCKKGENDPFLSLRSRKSRLVGEYDVTSYNYTIARVLANGDKNSFTTTIEDAAGTNVIITEIVGDPVVTTTDQIIVNKWEFNFKKDGTWTGENNSIVIQDQTVDGVVVESFEFTTESNLEEGGTWSFVGGQAEEFKNKERVALSTLFRTNVRQTTTVTNYQDGTQETELSPILTEDFTVGEGPSGIIYTIDRLTNKEMILRIDEGYTKGESELEDGTIDVLLSVVGTGHTEMVLTAK
jgi:hypothetical protein